MGVPHQPVGLGAGVLGGIIASLAFHRLWKATTGEKDAPDAADPDRSWSEVITAAAVHGAIFGGVKALVDRGAATGFQKATGTWPKKSKKNGKK
uniref:DUF4235 domain-containing protein n=1 Tax=Thermocrispum agreste TaxID=37925 RepID=A0A2W4JJS0_9PSEU|nr:MAG: hypothetical protein DIU77_06055 [Thermocrispum agreste]